MLIEMLKMLYREINMQRFCAQCISSWASSDKTLQSYSPDNSLFHTFPVTDDDAYTCNASGKEKEEREGIWKEREREKRMKLQKKQKKTHKKSTW